MTPTPLPWAETETSWTAQQDGVRYEAKANEGHGHEDEATLTITDWLGRPLAEPELHYPGVDGAFTAARQKAEAFAFMSTHGHHPSEKPKRAIWGRTRTRWIRHYVHVPDADAMLNHMQATPYRPKPACGASLPQACDPWLFVFSRKQTMQALDDGDEVCKRCMAHLGLYQTRQNQKPRQRTQAPSP